jgi:Glycosyl transferase family 2
MMSDDADQGFDIVIATTGRATLGDLLDVLAGGEGPRPRHVVVVDDRRAPADPLLPGRPAGWVGDRLVVVAGGGRGPAAARNAGWRACAGKWVVFLDDDVLPEAGWLAALAADLAQAGPETAAVQGRLTVPLPPGRRPTDWERNVRALQDAPWITADMAVRRHALRLVGGFDERFPRAYREDADLALRLRRAGLEIAWGARRVAHPVREAPWWVSLRLQAGNRDDVLMDALHGRGWRSEGRRPRRLHAHLATAAAGAVALPAWGLHLPQLAVLAAAAWLALTAQLAWARLAPGPGGLREIATMLATSVLMPFVVAYHWCAAMLAVRRLLRARAAPRPALVAVDGALATVLERVERGVGG